MNTLDKRLDDLEQRALRVARLSALAAAERWAHVLGKSLDEALEPQDACVELFRHLGGDLDEDPAAPPSESPASPMYLTIWVMAYVAHRDDNRRRSPDLVVQQNIERWRYSPARYLGNGRWDWEPYMRAMATEHDGWDADEFVRHAEILLAEPLATTFSEVNTN